jgi:hypothetical protein
MSVKGTNHSAIFSLFEQVGKGINLDSLGDSRWKVMGEAKAPMWTFSGMSVSYEESTQAREDPNLSKSRREKC